jgi:Uma2 family endonuclease
MQKRVEDEVHYDDFPPLEEESVPETILHAELIEYLVAVLRWLFRGHVCMVCKNLAFFPPHQLHEPPMAPDIAIIKGVPHQPLNSWRVGRTGPAPQVVFEILSGETWKKDVQEKPVAYAHMGVQEYFAYDPNLILLAGTTADAMNAVPTRLLGWRLDPASGSMAPLILQSGGSLWSQELDSILVPDEQLLRLYDRNHQLRLTGEEAEAQRAEAEARRANALAEKLRSLGIDPDQL